MAVRRVSLDADDPVGLGELLEFLGRWLSDGGDTWPTVVVGGESVYGNGGRGALLARRADHRAP